MANSKNAIRLKKLNARARQIRAKHPGMSYQSAQKKAGREFREGGISGVRKRKKTHVKKRARVGSRVQKFSKPRKMVNVTHYAGGTVGSVAFHKSAAKHQLEEKLAYLLLQLTHPMKAKTKRNLLKRKAKYLREIKALS